MSNLKVDFSRSSDTYFYAFWREKYNDIFSFSVSLLDKKLYAINLSLKNGHFYYSSLNSHQLLVRFKSQHIVVIAITALCCCFRIFPSCYSFLDIVDFLEKLPIWGENESLFHKIDNISKIITARANPKTATEVPYCNNRVLRFEVN